MLITLGGLVVEVGCATGRLDVTGTGFIEVT